MTRNISCLAFLALASLSQAAPNVCPQASAIATALSKASISVTPFCSSFLGITTKTSTVTATSTPTPTTVDSTSTVLTTTTALTSITSTVTTFTVTTTATSYSIDGSNKKRGLATGKHIANPVESDSLDKRTLPKSTAKIPPCLTAFASSIISSGCACLSIPTPTQTVTVTTTLPKSTATLTATTTVIITTTTTSQIPATATATSTAISVVDVCKPSNNYGFIYSGGYAALESSQTGVGASSTVVANAASQQACCTACYNTPACYIYYLDSASNSQCTLQLTQGGSSTAATAQCPLGTFNEFPASDDPSQAYYGLGACSRFSGFS